jgi:hypothetical protein
VPRRFEITDPTRRNIIFRRSGAGLGQHSNRTIRIPLPQLPDTPQLSPLLHAGTARRDTTRYDSPIEATTADLGRHESKYPQLP